MQAYLRNSGLEGAGQSWICMLGWVGSIHRPSPGGAIPEPMKAGCACFKASHADEVREELGTMEDRLWPLIGGGAKQIY